jgi:hypothetical protein
VLCFVGAKMMLVDVYKIPIGVSLSVIGGVLLVSILASWLLRFKTPELAIGPSVHRRVSARANPLLIGGIAILLLIAVLLLVKFDSIARGPTSREAITVIGVVERDLARAKEHYSGDGPAALTKADRALEQAWSDLADRQYDEAIATAKSARKLLDQLPAATRGR